MSCNSEKVWYTVLMRKNNKKSKVSARDKAWGSADRQAYSDGVRLRATTIQGKRWEGAEADEWDDGEDWDDWD